ncbi:MAG: hypothetical protein MUC49_14795 [Raineya sp.]|jgi:hypothetical protein|nr:hypothetical protein [Raineya sp.]
MSDGSETILNGLDGKKKFARVLAPTRELAQFLNKESLLEAKIRKGLRTGEMQIENVYYYGTSNNEGAIYEIFKTDGEIATGVSNVSKGKLEADRPAVVSKILLEYSATPSATFANVEMPASMKGEVILKVDDKILLSVPLQAFKRRSNQANDPAVYELLIDGKIIPDQKKIEMQVKLATTVANSAFRGSLVGCGVKSK